MEDDASYCRRRAEQALELAQQAVDPSVVHAHYELAEAYLARIGRDEENRASPTGERDHPIFALGAMQGDSV